MVYIQNTLCIINLIWSCILGNSQIGPYLFRDTSFKKQGIFNEHMVKINSIGMGLRDMVYTQNIVCVKELICSYILGNSQLLNASYQPSRNSKYSQLG